MAASVVDLFVTTINGSQLLTIVTESFFLDVARTLQLWYKLWRMSLVNSLTLVLAKQEYQSKNLTDDPLIVQIITLQQHFRYTTFFFTFIGRPAVAGSVP